MATPIKSRKKKDEAGFWKNKHDKQQLVLNALLSLLNKYGTSLELRRLYRELLLTIMGQFLARNAAYFVFDDMTSELRPAMNFGPPREAELHAVKLDERALAELAAAAFPCFMDPPPGGLADCTGFNKLGRFYKLYSPLLIKRKLVGVVFAGPKVTGQPYSESDFDLLQAFCEASAVTFNNAKLYENAKLSAREVKRLIDMRTELISRITHEFRTPITVIRSGLHTLEIAPEYEEVMKWINSSLDRLEDLIQSLLSISEENSESEVKAWDYFNPLAELAAMISKYGRENGNRVIELIDNGIKQHPRLTMSRTAFEKTMRCLLENAIKFSGPEAMITVELEGKPRKPDPSRDGIALSDWKSSVKETLQSYERLAELESGGRSITDPGKDRATRLSESRDENYWVFKVRDEGIGIPPEEVEQIVEPFRQASNSPERGIKGKGLGLTLALKLLQEYSGSLYCNSRLGEGSTFTVFIPCAAEE
jgi:signal transduction histidine kinase